jgi:hypothetical protein
MLAMGCELSRNLRGSITLMCLLRWFMRLAHYLVDGSIHGLPQLVRLLY